MQNSSVKAHVSFGPRSDKMGFGIAVQLDVSLPGLTPRPGQVIGQEGACCLPLFPRHPEQREGDNEVCVSGWCGVICRYRLGPTTGSKAPHTDLTTSVRSDQPAPETRSGSAAQANTCVAKRRLFSACHFEKESHDVVSPSAMLAMGSACHSDLRTPAPQEMHQQPYTQTENASHEGKKEISHVCHGKKSSHDGVNAGLSGRRTNQCLEEWQCLTRTTWPLCQRFLE